MDMKKLQDQLRAFAQARDWEQFHSPKNLSMALSVEVAELVEVFQWASESESRNPGRDVRAAAEEEIADIQIYLARLADVMGINIEAAVERKIEQNAAKYPADKVRGSSKKYTEYE